MAVIVFSGGERLQVAGTAAYVAAQLYRASGAGYVALPGSGVFVNPGQVAYVTNDTAEARRRPTSATGRRVEPSGESGAPSQPSPASPTETRARRGFRRLFSP
jgi:hypothetical protein